MGGDTSREAHGDARVAIDKDQGEEGGEDFRFLFFAIKVGYKVEIFFIQEVGEAQVSDAGFGIAIGSWGVAFDRSIVAHALDKGVFDSPGGGKGNEGFVCGGVMGYEELVTAYDEGIFIVIDGKVIHRFRGGEFFNLD
jgi:hypothetical protein